MVAEAARLNLPLQIDAPVGPRSSAFDFVVTTTTHPSHFQVESRESVVNNQHAIVKATKLL